MQVVHRLLNVLCALDSPADRVISRILPVAQLFVDGWPHDDHRITHKLDDVTAVLI